MKKIKKINNLTIYFLSFAMVLWNSGLSTVSFPLINKASADDDSNQKVLICHKDDDDFETIEVDADAVQAHLEHGDSLGKCSNEDEDGDDDDQNSNGEIVSFSPWCSALNGIVSYHLGYPAQCSVQDLDNSGDVDSSDVSTMSDWYGAYADSSCYAQFNDPQGGLQFNCDNYLQINWCEGLKKGVTDSLGSATGDAKYSTMFDLNHDGFVDASDLANVAMYLGVDNRQGCFEHFNFELRCDQNTTCGNGEVDEGEQCDLNSAPQVCVTNDGYLGTKDCNLPSIGTTAQGLEIAYCQWDTCTSQDYCGDGQINGHEQCDDSNTNSQDGCSATCQIEEHVYAPWCSALYGIVEKELGQTPGNSIPDMNNDNSENSGDWSSMMSLYLPGDNETCYQQFNDDGYQFNCENYLDVDWCNGLKQGVIDSLGTSTSSPNYWSVYDLNNDGNIDASDLSSAAAMTAEGNQQTCFDRFPFELNCQPNAYCGNEVVDEGEECDGNGPMECTTQNGYTGIKTCHMPISTIMSLLVPEQDVPYCHWNPCQTNQYCGDGIVNGNEQCDAGENGSRTCDTSCHTITPPGPTNGGGGGGGGGLPANGPTNIATAPQCQTASMSWLTNVPSISWVVYGTTSGIYTGEFKDATAVTFHSINIPGLAKNTTYYYRVKMQTAGGTVYTGPESSFVTKADCAPVPQVLGEKITDNYSCNWDWRFLKDGKRAPDTDSENRINYPEGTLIRGCINVNVYRIENGKGRWIKSWQELHDKYRGQRIFNIPEDILDLFIK